MDESRAWQMGLPGAFLQTLMYSMARCFANYVGDLMPRSNHSVLVNAFRPAQEVDDPKFFAGRARQIAELTDALHLVGSTPLIYGARGLGKTSLALQMMGIAQGAVELLSAQRIQDKAFNETERYLVFLVTCTDATRNFDGLLQELINAAEEADFPETESTYRAKHLAERTMIQKISLKFIEVQRSRKFIPEKARRSYRNLSPDGEAATSNPSYRYNL